MQRSTIAITLGVLCFLALTSWLRAQTANGSLRGEVQDQRGGRIAEADISLDASGIGLKQEATSDSNGEFRVNDLPPGPYHVMVSAKGFADASTDVSVVVSFVRDLSVTLKASTAPETV